MNFNNFTIKSQEAIQKAVEITRSGKNHAIEPVHLLKGVISEGESVVNFIFQKLGINSQFVNQQIERSIASLPKVSGGEPYLSGASNDALEKASACAQKRGDQYVSLEMLLMGILRQKSFMKGLMQTSLLWG